MPAIRLLDLGTVSPLRSQTVYHAVAHAMTPDSPDTILLVSPARPYVCIGFHQDVDKEVDLAYCRAQGLPVYRREVGGGAVYLDNGQLFIQWIFRRDRLPRLLEEQFALYIRPLVKTYQAIGLNAYHRPVNDIQVDGRKIGGTGAAQIGQAEVVVGSLMFDFDKATMARVLKVASEKMRDKIFESLEQYMTTLAEQLDPVPDREAVKMRYITACKEALGAEIIPGEWTAAEEAAAVRLDRRFISEEWLNQRGGLQETGVKIHEDVRLFEAAYKAPGGLIRVTVRLRIGLIDDLVISGDFTLLPAAALSTLETSLLGLSATRVVLLRRLQELFEEQQIQSPGIAPEHFADAILTAVRNGHSSY